MSKKTVLIYDGNCSLCNGSVQLIKGNLTREDIRVLPYQSVEGGSVIESKSIERPEDALILIEGDTIKRGPDAIMQVLSHLSWPWKVLLIVGKIIPQKIREKIYFRIASKRYDWFGKSSSNSAGS